MPIIVAGGPSSSDAPGKIPIISVPKDFTWFIIKLCAPAPTAIIIITAATPMIMPSIVKKLLPLLVRSALVEILTHC